MYDKCDYIERSGVKLFQKRNIIFINLSKSGVMMVKHLTHYQNKDYKLLEYVKRYTLKKIEYLQQKSLQE